MKRARFDALYSTPDRFFKSQNECKENVKLIVSV
jgi:hypothetical protein